MKKYIVLLVLLLINIYSSTLANSMRKRKELNAIWFIGDSITQSNADGDNQSSPRKELYELLKANEYQFSYTGHYTKNIDGLPSTGEKPKDNLYQYHSGISGILIGDTTKGINPRLVGIGPRLPEIWNTGRIAEVKPNIILIMLGTNDIGWKHDLPHAPRRLKTLLNTIYSLEGIGQSTVYLANIPPGGTPRHIVHKKNINLFNAQIPQIVQEYKKKGKQIYFVDMFTPLNEKYSENMMPDNLHPNAKGNKVIAQQWYNAMKKHQ